MRICTALLLCAGLVAGDALACGMSGTVVPFEVVGGGSDASTAGLPAPAVSLTEVVRGIGTSHGNCDDTGLLTVMVEWPRGGPGLREVGFEFEVVGSPDAYRIFPAGPVQGRVNRRRSEFLFLWRDGAPPTHQFIDLRVQVRAVTAKGERGPATTLLVRVPPAG